MWQIFRLAPSRYSQSLKISTNPVSKIYLSAVHHPSHPVKLGCASMLPSFQAPSRQEGIKWTTTRYHHPSTVFNGVYPANVAGVLLITPRLCKGRDATAWIRSRWSKAFNAHHWICLVWWRSTRWDLLWQHWLGSLMQELNIMYQRIAWATWGWSTKVRGWACKTGCVIISSLHHEQPNMSSGCCMQTQIKIFKNKWWRNVIFQINKLKWENNLPCSEKCQEFQNQHHLHLALLNGCTKIDIKRWVWCKNVKTSHR